MAIVNLLNNVVLADTATVGDDGAACLYTSGSISTNPSSALEVTINYKNETSITAGAEPSIEAYLILETSDSQGNWTTFHQQFVPFTKTDRGNNHKLVLDRNILVVDPGVTMVYWSGNKASMKEDVKQGRLPTNFRAKICLLDHAESTAQQFKEITCTLSYELY